MREPKKLVESCTKLLDIWEKEQRRRTNQIVLRFFESMLDLYELSVIADRGKFKIRDRQFPNDEVYVEHNIFDKGGSQIYYDTLADVLYRLSGSFLESYVEQTIIDCERDWEEVPERDYLAMDFTNSPIISEILHDISPSEYKKIVTNDDSTKRMLEYWRMNYMLEIKPILYPNGKPNEH